MGRSGVAAQEALAHEAAGLTHVAEGVRVARKGWLTREQVLNTRDLAGVLRWFKERR